MKATREVYVSVDVEADGPIPGEFSMLSIGACLAAVRERDGSVRRLDPEADTFYAELQPISARFVPEAAAVGGLDRDVLAREGQPPEQAARAFVDWVRAAAAPHAAKPVFTAYPLGFDWQFTYYYCVRFAGESPFGHSAHYDMKTAYATIAGAAIRDSVKRNMPAEVLGGRPHTHNALDDALGQADMCVALLERAAALGR